MSRLNARWVLMGAFAALACAHAPPQSREGRPPEAVSLRFAWPERFAAEIRVRHEGETWGGDPVRRVATRLMTTSPRPGGLLVETQAAARESGAPMPTADAPTAPPVGELVSRDGHFVGVQGLGPVLKFIQRSERVSPEVARHALSRSIADDWAVLVGTWAGKTLVQGEPRRAEVAGSVPLLPAADSVLDAELGYEGRTPCTPEETALRCVALHYRGHTAPGDRAATLLRVRRALVGSSGDAELLDYHAHFEATLVTEPETLVPHRLVDREALRVRVRLGNGTVREIEQRSQDEYVFTRIDRPGDDAAPDGEAAGGAL